MGIERARGGNGIGEHGRVTRPACDRGKDFGDRHSVLAISKPKAIIGRSEGVGNSSRLDPGLKRM